VLRHVCPCRSACSLILRKITLYLRWFVSSGPQGGVIKMSLLPDSNQPLGPSKCLDVCRIQLRRLLCIFQPFLVLCEESNTCCRSPSDVSPLAFILVTHAPPNTLRASSTVHKQTLLLPRVLLCIIQFHHHPNVSRQSHTSDYTFN
jgi:hypothetical protein